MNKLYNNKYAFLNRKPRLGIILAILLLGCCFILVFLGYTEIYDVYQTKGIYSCNDKCTITTLIPTTIDLDKISINNKNVDYDILSKTLKVDENNYVSYYELILETNKKYSNEEILNISFYYKKQSILKKIQEKMF